MDQAALQWVLLEQSSGAPCRTAWGAREQQKSACMVRSLVDENRWLCSLPTLRVSGTCLGRHCWRLLCVLQRAAGLSGTMTSWNVLNSSAVGPFNELAATRATLPKLKMVWLTSCVEVHLFAAWFRCLSVESSHFLVSCYLHDSWLFCMLSRQFERCLRRRSTTGRARSLVQVCTFPYEIRGPALFVLWWLYGWFSLVCESSWAPLPYAPPAGGVLGTMTTATFLPTENGRLRSLTLRPSAQAHLRGRWERQFYRSVIMYSSLHLCQRRRAWCFDFHVSLNVVVDNSFLACFWARRSGQTAVSRGKSFLWVFLFGLLPLSCVWFAVFLDET